MRYVIFTAGGHARVVAEALQAAKHEVIAFVDDDPKSHSLEVLGLPVRSFEWLTQQPKETTAVALGLGDNTVRHALWSRCTEAQIAVVSVIHPSAVVSPTAQIGAATVVLANAVVNACARIGAGCIINTGAIVEHDVHVGEFSHVSPNAVLAGGSRLGAFSHLGVGAVVLDDIFVGSRTIVGAGSVVNRVLPDDVVAYGVPARVKRNRS